MSKAHDEAAVHERLARTIPTYAPNTPLSHWASMDDPRHELRPGTVLKAKDGDPSDPFNVVKVTGAYGTRPDQIEYGITPFFEFGEIISAPARGPSGILTHYVVLGESEVAALLAERAAADAPVDAARRQLDAARAEEGR